MKFLIIHSRYSRVGGEENVVLFQAELLREAGHEVVLYERDYGEISGWRFGRLGSLFSALYNRRSVRDVRRLVADYRPDVAIVHNLFPVVSPAVLPVLKRAGVRVLMTVHNYRLLCPTGLFFREGRVCEQCASGVVREWNCLGNRCEGSVAGSFGYSLRGWWSRVSGVYVGNVDKFMVLSDFQSQKLQQYGFRASQIAVLPNAVNIQEEPAELVAEQGYVAFVGRLSPEKGVDLLFKIARLLPEVTFKIAGDKAERFSQGEIPRNVELVGFLNGVQLDNFYRSSSIVIHTSGCYEGLPLSVLEAMSHAKCVVAQNFAALPMLLQNGDCGALVEYNNPQAFAHKIQQLLNNPQQRNALAQKAKQNVTQNYSKEQYLKQLLAQCQ